MSAKVLHCIANCPHEYQDKKYGKGKRVMNPTKSSGSDYRCTVCGKVNSGGSDKSDKPAEGTK